MGLLRDSLLAGGVSQRVARELGGFVGAVHRDTAGREETRNFGVLERYIYPQKIYIHILKKSEPRWAASRRRSAALWSRVRFVPKSP